LTLDIIGKGPGVTGKALVIGYGNSLRGDDGIGLAVANALANEPVIDRAHVIVCHQLTPELAECLAAVELAIFVDAAADIKPGIVVVREIHAASPPPSALAHTADPALLLALTRKLYNRSPQAFLVTIGVSSLALGEGLSDAASAALPEAKAAVHRLLSKRPGKD
jgi:hydrogenase maturation protease